MSLMDHAKQLTSAIMRKFGAERVECVLLHGSVLFNPEFSPQDIDLVVVLKSNHPHDCQRFNQIFKSERTKGIPVQAHLLYLNEIPFHADYFSIHTCGCFFVPHLREALSLYGRNVFQNLSDPTKKQLVLSLLQKVQQYTFTLRNNICHFEKLQDKDLLQTRKRTFVVLKDLLMAHGIRLQDHKEIVNISLQQFPTIFDKREKQFLQKLADYDYHFPVQSKKMELLTDCLRIYEKAYSALREHVAKQFSVEFH